MPDFFRCSRPGGGPPAAPSRANPPAPDFPTGRRQRAIGGRLPHVSGQPTPIHAHNLGPWPKLINAGSGSNGPATSTTNPAPVGRREPGDAVVGRRPRPWVGRRRGSRFRTAEELVRSREPPTTVTATADKGAVASCATTPLAHRRSIPPPGLHAIAEGGRGGRNGSKPPLPRPRSRLASPPSSARPDPSD